MTPKVSIIIPHFNYGKYIDQCIDSCLNQTFQDFEIILVDDCSTEENILDVLKKQESKDNRIKLFFPEEKLFPNISPRNFCIHRSSGEFIYPLDADNYLHPTCLEKLMAPIQNRLCDFSYCWYERFGDSSSVEKSEDFNVDVLFHHNYIDAGGMFKRSDFDVVGGYDRNCVTQDWAFWLQMAAYNKKGLLVKEVLYYYRVHSSGVLTQFVQHEPASSWRQIEYMRQRFHSSSTGNKLNMEIQKRYNECYGIKV